MSFGSISYSQDKLKYKLQCAFLIISKADNLPKIMRLSLSLRFVCMIFFCFFLYRCQGRKCSYWHINRVKRFQVLSVHYNAISGIALKAFIFKLPDNAQHIPGGGGGNSTLIDFDIGAGDSNPPNSCIQVF